MKQLSKALQKIKKLIFSLRVRYSQIYQKNIPKDKKLFLGIKSYTSRNQLRTSFTKILKDYIT